MSNSSGSVGRFRYIYAGPNKVVGCLYSEVSGNEVKYSYVFVHPKEDVITTVVANPKFPGATRKVFTVNASRARLRVKAKELFDNGNSYSVSVPEKTCHEITVAILNDVAGRVPYTTRASIAIDNELVLLYLANQGFAADLAY